MKSTPKKKTGKRPVLYPDGRRVIAILTPEQIEIARRLGVGNVSTGIRIALERAGKE